MKQNLLLSLLLLTTWAAQAQTLLQQQSFEGTGTDAAAANAYSSTTVSTGSNNIYFLRSQLPVPGYNKAAGATSTVTGISGTAAVPAGTWFWASESVRRLFPANTVRGNPPANVTLASLNVAGKSSLSVTVALADASGLPGNNGVRWETDDYVRIQYRFNGTGSWNTIGQFVGDGSNGGGPPASGALRQDYFPCDGVANAGAPVLNQALTDYTFPIPGSGTTLQVRVEIDDDGFSEEFGFDNIRVYGSSAVGSPPVLGGIESTPVAFAEGGSPVALTSTLTVSDPDSPGLASGSVSISAAYNSSEDRLSFVGDASTGNITAGTFNTGTGVLPLTSAGATATPAQWQSAFRRVFYQNIDFSDALAGTRTVSFSVTDPNNNIAGAVQRNITVTSALDAASNVPYTESFETDGEGTRYASNHYFSQDAAQFQRTNANPTTTGPGGTTFTNIAAGTSYWVGVNTALTSQNPTGLNNGTLTTKQVSAAGYTGVHFQLRIGASAALNNGNQANWTTSDYFQLFYRLNGSSTWTAFGLFRGTGTGPSGGVIRQDANPTGTGVPTGTQLTPELQNFDFALPALNGQIADFRLVLVNTDGVNYLAFDQLQLTATLTLPTVTTTGVSNPAATSATLGGNVTDQGGSSVTGRGVVYSRSATVPALGGAGVTQAANGTGTGVFSGLASGLTPATTYYVRAYATNSSGTAYGSVESFATPTPTITLTPTTLPNGAVGTAYNQPITASGGTGPYTFSLVRGSLPPGLTLTSAGGLSGTPTAAGSFSPIIQATDANAYGGSQAYNLTIAAATTVASVTGLTPSPTATAQVSYRVVFAASVTGVTDSNFSLSPTVTGASISSVSGAGTTYTVVVNTGTGDGTLRLNVQNGAGISPTVRNVPYTDGTVYTITRSFGAAPTLRIQGAGSATTNGDVTAFVDLVQVVQSGTSTPVANALQNGSFESNNVPAGSFLYSTSTPTAVVAVPWTFGLLSGVSRNGSGGFGSTAPAGGENAVGLLQRSNSSIAQNLAVPTGTYQVNFQAVQRNNNGFSDQVVNVFLVEGSNDVFIGSIQPASNTTYQAFTSATFSVTAPVLTATVSTTSGSPTRTTPIPFSVSFARSVGTTFAAADVTVTGGTLTSASFSGSGAGPYTFTVTPTGTTGTVTVSVAAGVATDANNTGNEASKVVSVQYQPTGLSGVSPAAELPGQVVTLTGTGFTSGSTVTFGTTAASVTLVSATTLTVSVPAGLAPGSAPVSVSTGGSTTPVQPFTVLAVYDGGTLGNCAAAVPATSSVGDGAWHYLLSAAGQVVAAYRYAGASLGTLTLDVLRADPTQPVRQDAGNRYYLGRNWHLTASAGRFDGRTVALRLYGLNSEQARLQVADNTATLANLKTTQYSGPNEDCQLANNGPGESRVLPAPASSPVGTSYFVAELAVADHFSEFYLTGSPIPLPVELTEFTATPAGPAAVRLAWATASEKNSASFEGERSLDGRTFTRIGTIAAANSSTPHRYELLDARLPAGAALLYYRLRQVDLDGTFSYSPVRTVALTGAAAGLALFPNPTRATTTLTGARPGAVVTMLDALGRVVLTAPADATGTAGLALPTGLATGVYVVRAGSQALRLTVE